MEHRIGVGIIVGLVTAAGLFIYNYLRNYKAIKFKQEDERLNNTKKELEHLNKKGLLTSCELEEKKNKLQEVRTEKRIKETKEYSALKGLHASGLLTAEEFQDKVKSLERSITLSNKETLEEIKNSGLDYSLSFLGDHHSFSIGNYKAWVIIWSNGYTQDFFTKNSNGKYFIEKGNKPYYFSDKEEFIVYSLRQSKLNP